jgi:hypothetical protein
MILAAPAMAGNKGKGKKNAGSQGIGESVQTLHAITGVISAVERAIISSYLDRNQAHLPPVLANAKPLPPGIAKKIARGGAMPPGIAKKSVPGALLSELPSRPGQKWLLVGTDLLVVEIATNVIVDVLKGAIRSG